MIDRTAQPKPAKGTAKRQKASAKRQESKHAKGVRAQCVERDGRCLIYTRSAINDYMDMSASLVCCEGPSEWAHIGQHRRCHTRGQAAEARHTTQGSGMLCKRHHDAYDAHEFDIQPTTSAGMDGAFAVMRRAA